ncbi:unnamed protein product [Ixodes hexagonus]
MNPTVPFLEISWLVDWCLAVVGFGTFIFLAATLARGYKQRSAKLQRLTREKKKKGNPNDVLNTDNPHVSILTMIRMPGDTTRYVSILAGLDLVAFRTKDGIAHVADAHCPHLGAHLGFVGRVVGDCIECPFHGWRFSGKTGACTHAPFSTKVPEFVKLKQWDAHEVLGFLFVWHHAEGEEPSWRIEDIPLITNGDWKPFSRFDHRISCHLRDLAENAFDTAHAQYLHKANAFLSPAEFVRGGGECFWGRFMVNHWTAKNSTEAHRCFVEIEADVSILGKLLPFLHTTVSSQGIGPAFMLERAQCRFGTSWVVIAMLPEEPLQVRVIQKMYFEPNAPWLFRWAFSRAHLSHVRGIQFHFNNVIM